MKRRYTKLELRVRSTDCPTLDVDGAVRGREFDAGWRARVAGKPVDRMGSVEKTHGWLAADAAWFARHNAMNAWGSEWENG